MNSGRGGRFNRQTVPALGARCPLEWDERCARERNRYRTNRRENPVQYFLSGREPAGYAGRTVAISSNLIRFECGQGLRAGHKIRLVLAWPAALPDGTGLNLWIAGRIAHCTRGEVEVEVANYEFRTRARVEQMREPNRWGSRAVPSGVRALAGARLRPQSAAQRG